MADLWNKTKSFAIKSRRVWQILKKPTRKEFETITKVSAVGILILGLLGFIISSIIKSFI